MRTGDGAERVVAGGQVKILLADDHTIVREGILSLLQAYPEVVVVGTAEDGQEAVEKARRSFPDVVVMDIAMPLLNGIEAARQIKKHLPDTRVIVLTMYADEEYVLRALQAGVRGYLLKRSAPSELLQAIRAVQHGDFYLSSDISHVVIERFLATPAEREEPGSLSQRERQILQLVAEGYTNRQISEALGITPKTVDTHRTRLKTKLGIHDTPGLVRYAIRKGIVQADP